MKARGMEWETWARAMATGSVTLTMAQCWAAPTKATCSGAKTLERWSGATMQVPPRARATWAPRLGASIQAPTWATTCEVILKATGAAALGCARETLKVDVPRDAAWLAALAKRLAIATAATWDDWSLLALTSTAMRSVCARATAMALRLRVPPMALRWEP